MNIITKAENRPAMARAIAEHLGIACEYPGPPSFGFKIGELMVKRDGSLTSENLELLEQVKPFLREREWLDDSIDQWLVSIPLIGMTGVQLTNIVNMIRSKQYLLNRILRKEQYAISMEFIQQLKTHPPQTQEEFLALYTGLPESACVGLYFDAESVSFAFDFGDSSKRNQAYTQLSSCIVKACKEAKRVSPGETVSDNEKFYVRAWLVRIGMGGAEYRQSRRLLMDALKGHSAFKTEEQKERHRLKHMAVSTSETAAEV